MRVLKTSLDSAWTPNTKEMRNVTEVENHTASLCTTGLGGTDQNLIFSALNSTLAITAFLANILIIVALQKVSSLNPPSNLLLCSLASTDLCVGLIQQPLRVAFFMSPENSIRCHYLYNAFNFTSLIFTGVSLLTITAVSVDRLLALVLGLRYRQVVTLRRARIFVATSWLSCFIAPSVYVYSVRGSVILSCTAAFLCTVTSTFCYTKIYLTLRHHQTQVRDHVHQEQDNGGGIPLNISRYKRTLSSALWVKMTLLVCYFPYTILAAIFAISAEYFTLAWELSLSLIMLNSSLNPIMYCWKMGEVRKAVKDTIRLFWYSLN